MTISLTASSHIRLPYAIAKASGLMHRLQDWEVLDERKFYIAQARSPMARKANYTHKPYTQDGDTIAISRGLIARLRMLPVQFTIHDLRIVNPFEKDLPPVDVRQYQAEAADFAIKEEQALLWAPTSSGKTRIASSIIQRLKQRTLILVHTIDIQEQFLEELRYSLEITPGIRGGGECFDGDEVTVAQAQHFRNWTEKEWVPFVQQFGCVIVDECHLGHRGLAERFPAKYRFGMTATPDIIGDSSEVTQWPFGKKFAVADHQGLVDGGFRVQPVFDWLYTEFSVDGPEDYQAILDALVKNEARAQLICTDVRNRWCQGRSCLILCGQIKYGKLLMDCLTGLGVPATLLTSEIPKATRALTLERARKGDVRVLVATSLADVGLDVPLLDTLYLTFPGRSTNLTHQRIGRVLRFAIDKSEPLIIDVVDQYVPTLFSQALHRQAAMQAYGDLPKKLIREKKRQRKPVF